MYNIYSINSKNLIGQINTNFDSGILSIQIINKEYIDVIKRITNSLNMNYNFQAVITEEASTIVVNKISKDYWRAFVEECYNNARLIIDKA